MRVCGNIFAGLALAVAASAPVAGTAKAAHILERTTGVGINFQDSCRAIGGRVNLIHNMGDLDTITSTCEVEGGKKCYLMSALSATFDINGNVTTFPVNAPVDTTGFETCHNAYPECPSGMINEIEGNPFSACVEPKGCPPEAPIASLGNECVTGCPQGQGVVESADGVKNCEECAGNYYSGVADDSACQFCDPDGGRVLHDAGVPFSCGDFNECQAGVDDCGEAARCVNRDIRFGGVKFECVACPEGSFSGSDPDSSILSERNARGACLDMDECAEGLDDCPGEGWCRNLDAALGGGAYACECDSEGSDGTEWAAGAGASAACISRDGDDFGVSQEVLCGAFGGTLQVANGGADMVCSGMDASDTFCVLDSVDAFPCRGLFKHLRSCNLEHGRPAADMFFCGAKCREGSRAIGALCVEQ